MDAHHIEKEAESLERFYDSVKRRAQGIDSAEAKQRIVVELYDKFFRNAFPKMTERLGIVYTPVEVVDFIIHSVNEVLQSEFGQTLGSKGVHILDPFTGTGTFITRLLQSGLIKPEELEHKYKNEIHANEIVLLLAYYIAAINIEAVYHSLSGGDYAPFEGICLTDTFQLYEKEDLVSRLLDDNSSRRQKQKNIDIRVIVGNPPYSSGQRGENDNNKNITYPSLDSRIAETYVQRSDNKMGKSKSYDSYIRAIRWASDRLGSDGGVIAFVTGSAWIERSFADGMRRTLFDDFSDLYIIHLRGDVRKNMLSSGEAGEGENVFGSGSMTGIAISILVKNPASRRRGNIQFLDIGDNLSRNEKLGRLKIYNDLGSIAKKGKWTEVKPNPYGDWLAQRNEDFGNFIALGSKGSGREKSIFETYSMGNLSNRDSWVYNASSEALSNNIKEMFITFHSQQALVKNKGTEDIRNLITDDETKIKWDYRYNIEIKS